MDDTKTMDDVKIKDDTEVKTDNVPLDIKKLLKLTSLDSIHLHTDLNYAQYVHYRIRETDCVLIMQSTAIMCNHNNFENRYDYDKNMFVIFRGRVNMLRITLVKHENLIYFVIKRNLNYKKSYFEKTYYAIFMKYLAHYFISTKISNSTLPSQSSSSSST